MKLKSIDAGAFDGDQSETNGWTSGNSLIENWLYWIEICYSAHEVVLLYTNITFIPHPSHKREQTKKGFRFRLLEQFVRFNIEKKQRQSWCKRGLNFVTERYRKELGIKCIERENGRYQIVTWNKFNKKALNRH